MKHFFLALTGQFIILSLLSGCAAGNDPAVSPPLIVFAAASLSEAMAELGQQFSLENPGVEVIFNFAGSQQLAQQLVQGAPADLFASADQRQMAAAQDAGRITTGSEQIFSSNRLMIVYPADNPGQITGLTDLARPGLRLVLAAEAVPAGRYAREFLQLAGNDPTLPPPFETLVMANVVSYEENVRAVLSKVVLGEADAGIVYSSDAAGANGDRVGRLAIPTGLTPTIVYPIAPLLDSVQPETARAFIDFVLSPDGRRILAEHGFTPPDNP